MSHGGGGEDGVSAEPNLTPLLDLVLQLVMFFMLVANFIMDEMSDRVKLPSASQAKPLTAKDLNFTYVNVDRHGNILVPSKPPLIEDLEIQRHMREVARNHQKGETFALENMIVIVRADKDAKFDAIFKTIRSIKIAGYRQLQLRAEIASR